jgi:hypothetical protein
MMYLLEQAMSFLRVAHINVCPNGVVCNDVQETIAIVLQQLALEAMREKKFVDIFPNLLRNGARTEEIALSSLL